MSNYQARPMQFIELDTGFDEFGSGCLVPINRALNADGYLRKTWSVEGRKVPEMFHRFIFRAHNRLEAIPKGMEIDHLCNTRCCANPSHMVLMPRAAHLRKTNEERYALRQAASHFLWRRFSMAGVKLAEVMEVDQGTANSWIRNWRATATVLSIQNISADIEQGTSQMTIIDTHHNKNTPVAENDAEGLEPCVGNYIGNGAHEDIKVDGLNKALETVSDTIDDVLEYLDVPLFTDDDDQYAISLLDATIAALKNIRAVAINVPDMREAA